MAHFKMELVSYVARRMLKDVCEIEVPINPAYELAYIQLCRWTDYCSTWRGPELFPNLPCVKQTSEDLNDDMMIIYVNYLTRVEDTHSRSTLHGLFSLSLYMMIKYKEHPDMCNLISRNFELLTYRLGGWAYLNGV